jgi:broad specificity phosphatase PhoE
MGIDLVDIECGGELYRLQPGHLYVLRLPPEVSLEDARAIRQRLDQALDRMRDPPPEVLITSHDVTLEEVTVQAAGGRSP